MTREEALKALTAKAPAGMGLTRKMAGFLLGQAEKYGNGAHLKVEVFYTERDGFAVIDYSRPGESGSAGQWATPGTASA